MNSCWYWYTFFDVFRFVIELFAELLNVDSSLKRPIIRILSWNKEISTDKNTYTIPDLELGQEEAKE